MNLIVTLSTNIATLNNTITNYQNSQTDQINQVGSTGDGIAASVGVSAPTNN